MAADESSEATGPSGDFNMAMVRSIFDSMRDYIGLHSPEFGEDGRILDCRLRYWNKAYEKVRTKTVEPNQSLLETYFLPESALHHVNTAWETGHSYQLFTLSPDDGDRYRPEGAVVAIEVQWQRAGDYVMEIGSDLSEFQKAQNRIHQHEAEVAYSENALAVAEDRERIARDLHDSVIQNLFAVTLTIEDIIRSVTEERTRARLNDVRSTLSDVISEIRREIFDVRLSGAGSLGDDLSSITESLAEAAGVTITVDAPVNDISVRLRTNVRAVVREASANAIRHGRARVISVAVIESGGILTVTVENDGIPLPPRDVRQSGTRNMTERAGLLGGAMTLGNSDHGTVLLTWRVPIEHGNNQ